MEELNLQKVLSAQHQDWLGHPVTQQLIRNLTAHRESFVKTLSSGSANSSEPENMFRVYSYGIKTVDTILQGIKSTTEFVNKSEQLKK